MIDAAAGRTTGHQPRLSQLDGLRGLAALVILLYHAEIVYRLPGPFGRGYLFVDLFFLLSGFVLAVSTERKLNAGIGVLEFTWWRYKRLFPLVAVGVAVALARAIAIGLADPLTLALWLVLDLAMIPVLAGSGTFYRFNNPQWTLFWELLANFLHALLLRRLPTAVLPWLVAVLGAGLVYTVSLHGSDTLGANAVNRQTWWMPLPRIFFPYVLGMWMGRKYLAGTRTPGLPWWLALALPIVAIMLVPLLPWKTPAGDLLFVIGVLPMSLWLAVMCRPPTSLTPAMDWLGNFSLPLYCVHLTVLVWMSEQLGRERWVQALAILASFALAYFASRLISFRARPTEVKAKAPAA